MFLGLLLAHAPAAALELELTRRLPGVDDGRAECVASFALDRDGRAVGVDVANCEGAPARATRRLLAQMRFAGGAEPPDLRVHWCLGDEPCQAPSAATDAVHRPGAPPVSRLVATHTVSPAWPVGVVDEPEVAVTCRSRVYAAGSGGRPLAIEARDCSPAYFGPAAVALLDWSFLAVEGADGVVQSDIELAFTPDERPSVSARPTFFAHALRAEPKHTLLARQ